MFDFGLVRESLRERERLVHAAPHLVKPLPFIVPIYKGQDPGKLKLHLGLWLYDILAYDRTMPGRKWMSAADALALEPGLRKEGLTGAVMYYDGQISFVERLVIENALDAAHHGAVLANHVRVTSFTGDPENVTGARAVDTLTGRGLEIRAHVVVNASGPWLDTFPGADRSQSRMTKGIHLVIPQATRHGVLYFNQKDGRVFFAIPWNGLELVGTTDTDYAGDADAVRADADDMAYLKDVNRFVLPGAASDDVFYTWAGIRNLVGVKGVSESAVSRKHLLLDHKKLDGRAGLLSLVGGKITPYRAVCEEVVDAVLKRLGEKRPHSTRGATLPGAPVEMSVDGDVPAHIDEAAMTALIETYGSRHVDILARVRADSDLGKTFCAHAPTLRAEVAHAVESEMALTVADVVMRRTRLGLASCTGAHVAEDVAALMAPMFGWSKERVAGEVAAVHAELAKRSPP